MASTGKEQYLSLGPAAMYLFNAFRAGMFYAIKLITRQATLMSDRKS